jgi:hypothetical protein
MKKTALALALVLSIFVVFGVQFVQLVEANGWFIFRESDGPPIITIKSPLNNEVVSFNNVAFNFTLARPSYNWTLEGTTNKVVSANIIVDGTVYRKVDVNSELSVPYNYFGVNTEMSVPFAYSLNLTDLEDGEHTVQLDVYCRGTGIKEWTFGTDPYEFDYHAFSDIINFTVDTPEPTASPEATSPPATFPASLGLVAPVGITLAVTGLLVYFKRLKAKNHA